jgi:hypothetical protein
MESESSTVIESSPYRFNVKRKILTYDGNTISLTYRVGGDYDSCITISYTFNKNTPVSASIPRLSYEPECSLGSTLQKGAGTEILIRSAIQYAYRQVPSIHRFFFDDASHIDCYEGPTQQAPPRKQKKPLNLAYLSIAYYGMTWYEKTFKAQMIDEDRFTKYRNAVSFLTDPTVMLPFATFLQITQPSADQIRLLEEPYVSSRTYREFFNSIPREKRCIALFSWINTFMQQVGAVGHIEKGWYIDAHLLQKGGARKKTMKRLHVYNYSEVSNF